MSGEHMMKDRFDLENEINHIYSFIEQLDTLSEGISKQQLTNNEVVSAIDGLKVMLNLHTQKLHDTMSQCFFLDQYRQDI